MNYSLLLCYGRHLYWTSGDKLLRSSLSGENVEVLHTSQCYMRYLTLNTNLYWTQERCSSHSVEGVYSLDLSTHHQRVIASGSGEYGDVAVYRGTAYWTGEGRVYSAPITGAATENELLYICNYGKNRFRGITVVHPDLQPEY